MEAVTSTIEASVKNLPEVLNQVTWGRTRHARLGNSIGALIMVATAPLWMMANWVALEWFDGSLTIALRTIVSTNPLQLAQQYLPKPSLAAVLGYAAWIVLQALLYRYLPGQRCVGQRTPGGHLLSYTANGLMAWAITHLLYLIAAVLGVLNPATIAKNWQGFFVVANMYGFALSIAAQIKGYWAPSFLEDRKLSGSWMFDFWAGIELNPRLGENWDVKFFHNGRPGIVAWTLIDISWAAYQHQTLGCITKSMIVVLILQTMYVVDFFWNEDWYTRTVDITHDHFGFMLAWGDTTFLPTFYTLQAQYLARYPVHLSDLAALSVLAIGLSGYAIFRLANHQKDYVRSLDGHATTWGRPATFIRCTYWTDDGKEHNSILLTCGWWGVVRHSNYMADFILSWAMCATCGFKHALPWSYFFFMLVLLYHRAQRDEERCRSKYGAKWQEYCERVPYRLVPGLY